jgi:hypothetical protein
MRFQSKQFKNNKDQTNIYFRFNSLKIIKYIKKNPQMQFF